MIQSIFFGFFNDAFSYKYLFLQLED